MLKGMDSPSHTLSFELWLTMKSEKHVLFVSFYAILAFGTLGIVFGLLTGSSAIIFDGLFSFVDAVMAGLSILLVTLLSKSASDDLSGPVRRRFTMGFWHLEPLFLAANSVILMFIAGYALLTSIQSIRNGGHYVNFGPAVVYTILVLVISVGVATYSYRANRELKSAVVAMDIKGWLMTAGITGALLLAFSIALILGRLGYDHWLPYVDPVVLAIVAAVLLMVPVRTLWLTLGQILLITPSGLHNRAEAIAKKVAEEEGFDSWRTYAARVGRACQVEVEFHVPAGGEPRPLEYWDDLRDQVGKVLDVENPDNWITVSFTTRPLRPAERGMFEEEPRGAEERKS